MTCVHLQELYQLCRDHQLTLSGTDLIRVVCKQCGEQEVCPSMLTDEYDAKQPKESQRPEQRPERQPEQQPEQRGM